MMFGVRKYVQETMAKLLCQRTHLLVIVVFVRTLCGVNLQPFNYFPVCSFYFVFAINPFSSNTLKKNETVCLMKI